MTSACTNGGRNIIGYVRLIFIAVTYRDCTLCSCSSLSHDILQFSLCSLSMKRHCHSHMFLMYVYFLCPCSIKPALTALSSDPSLLWGQKNSFNFYYVIIKGALSFVNAMLYVSLSQFIVAFHLLGSSIYCIDIMPLIVKLNSLSLFGLANLISDMIIYYYTLYYYYYYQI